MFITAFNILFLVAYVLSAAVLYNDPDPFRWAALYLAAVAMCIIELRKRQNRWLPPLLLTIGLLWIGTLLSQVVGKITLAQIIDAITLQSRVAAPARDIGGLVLVVLWAGYLTFSRKQL
jgi:transmembrane protein TMEM220